MLSLLDDAARAERQEERVDEQRPCRVHRGRAPGRDERREDGETGCEEETRGGAAGTGEAPPGEPGEGIPPAGDPEGREGGGRCAGQGRQALGRVEQVVRS